MDKILMKILENKKGLSLVELMVSIAIMTILMGIVSTFVIRTYYVNRFSIEQGMNTAVLQNALKNLSNNIREAKQSDAGAYMIFQAEDFEFSFYADIDDDPLTERLHYYKDENQLKLGITKPSGEPAIYPSGDEEIRTIGNGIVNNSSQPIFLYYNKDYPNDAENNPLSFPVDISEIGLVKVELFVNINTVQVPDSMHMETFVRPRNIH